MRDLSYIGQRLNAVIDFLQRLRWPTLVLAVAALAYLGVQRNDLWHENLSVLSTVSAEDAKADGALRADTVSYTHLTLPTSDLV